MDYPPPGDSHRGVPDVKPPGSLRAFDGRAEIAARSPFAGSTTNMFAVITDLQRGIYSRVGESIQLLATGGDWGLFLAFVPLAILFGAVHATTPGHSKAVLATYLLGTPASVLRGLGVSLALSLTHVGISVLIALLALPLVSVALGSAGRAPLLEDVSRGLLGLLGLWMAYRAFRPPTAPHRHGEGLAFGFMAGLIPCPLTLFVMTYAIARGVTAAGLAFAAMMMLGVALTLGIVAVAAVLFRQRVIRLLANRPRLLVTATRLASGLAGIALVAVAAVDLTG
jgi:nickel/cobalt exporter